MVTPQDAKQIASRGRGMVLDAGKFTPTDLTEIASRANWKSIIVLERSHPETRRKLRHVGKEALFSTTHDNAS